MSLMRIEPRNYDRLDDRNIFDAVYKFQAFIKAFLIFIVGLCRYEGLDRFLTFRLQYPIKSMRFVAMKVGLDSIIFGPVDLFVFFTYMGFASGKNVSQVKEDVKRDFLPALVVEGGIWPIVQVINFRFVPVRYQLLYVNLFCLLDSCFLSWLDQQQDAPWKQWFKGFFFDKYKSRDG